MHKAPATVVIIPTNLVVVAFSDFNRMAASDAHTLNG